MDNREFVLSALRTFDEQGPEAFAALFAPDARLWTPIAELQGTEAITGFFHQMTDPFDGSTHTIERTIADGDTVVVEGAWSATHARPFATPAGEAPATGRTLRLPFAGIVEVRGERIVSLRNYFDQVGFMAQLGLMPEPATA